MSDDLPTCDVCGERIECVAAKVGDRVGVQLGFTCSCDTVFTGESGEGPPEKWKPYEPPLTGDATKD